MARKPLGIDLVLVAFLCTLLATSRGWAADAPPASQPVGLDASIAPLMDPDAILVVRIDLDRIDLAAAQDWGKQRLSALNLSKEDQAAAAQAGAQAWDHLVRAFGELKKTGARQVYGVLTMAGAPFEPGFIAVPADAGMDPQALVGAFNAIRYDGPPPTTQPGANGLTAKRIGNALVFAGPGTLQRLTMAARAKRPPTLPATWGDAAAAAGDSPIRVIVTPGTYAKRFAERFVVPQMPQLPPELGGGDTKELIESFGWAAGAIDVPPNGLLRFTATADSIDHAKSFADVISRGLTKLEDSGAGAVVPDFASYLQKISPQIKGTTVVMVADRDTVNNMIAPIAAYGLIDSYRKAKIIESMGNVQQLCAATLKYSWDHKGLPPDDVDALREGKYVREGAFEKLMTNPRDPQRKPGYVYVKPPGKLSQPKNRSEQILFYEAFDNWKDGVVVGYADGHGEFVTSEARFNQQLDESKKANP